MTAEMSSWNQPGFETYQQPTWSPDSNNSPFYQQPEVSAAGLPHIHSIMMKTETKEEHPHFPYRTPEVLYESKTDNDDYHPTQDAMLSIYGSSLTSTDFPHNSVYSSSIAYEAVQIIPDNSYYQSLGFPTPLLHNPQEPSLSTSQSFYSELPSQQSNYSPPPQDPQIIKPKKRIPAVPCHSNSICANCKTKETTLWRRNLVGDIECNACNLYFRKNNRKRPLSLRKDGILKRNRKPRCESPQGNRS